MLRVEEARAIRGLAAALLVIGSLAACDRGDNRAITPPRATSSAPSPTQTSLIAVPISADLGSIRRALERAVPRTLWTINKREHACVKPQRVEVFGRRIAVSPPIACTITGRVTRGALRLRGEGDEIVIDVPLRARIKASDIGGVLEGETATGSAIAHARVRIEFLADWSARGKARITYGWTTPPGIDFLGQRISFTDEADAKLAPVVRRVEREVSREIGKLDFREQAAEIWRQSFTSLELNHENPPVWMRLTPKRILYGGYRLDGQNLSLNLGLEAIAETFVSARPPDPAQTPLPDLVSETPRPHFDVRVPVIADYAQLEPVILRALVKRSARSFDLPGIGAVMTQFDKVTAYGTTGGRIAVGINFNATPTKLGRDETSGTVWLTAKPVNAANSAEVSFSDLRVTGDTDSLGGDLLLRISKIPEFTSLIADALTQNFTRDLNELEGKIRRATEQRREGPFVIRTSIDSFETGTIEAYGNGLYLPVRMIGEASVDYRPAD